MPKTWIDTYANATITVLTKTRNKYGRWSYDLTASQTIRARVAPGNRLVEGVNGNIRALTAICDQSIILDVDDRFRITMDTDSQFAKNTTYAIIGAERSATLDTSVKTQRLTCIEAAVTTEDTGAVQPPSNFSPNAPLSVLWDGMLTWEREEGGTITHITAEYDAPGAIPVRTLIISSSEKTHNFLAMIGSDYNIPGDHQFAVVDAYCSRAGADSTHTGLANLIRWTRP